MLPTSYIPLPYLYLQLPVPLCQYLYLQLASRIPQHTQPLWTVPLCTAIKCKVQRYRHRSWKPFRLYPPLDPISWKLVLHNTINVWWSDTNAKEKNSPVFHQYCSGYITASAENSPLRPMPSVWRSSVGDKVHFGCRPCYAEAPSALHRGYSLWIPSQKQSADKSKPKGIWAKANLLTGQEELCQEKKLAWRNYPLNWACITGTFLNQPQMMKTWPMSLSLGNDGAFHPVSLWPCGTLLY